MNPVRESARVLRLRIEAGDMLSMDEAIAACVTLADALTAFERAEDAGDEGTRVICCGQPASITDGIFGTRVECLHCKAKAVDATSPLFSPFLERGSGHVTVPSKEWVDQFGERTWIVMHEGSRP